MKSLPLAIGTVLDGLVKDLGIGQKIEENGVFEVWESVVGQRIAEVARAERVEKGVLLVRVSAAPWRTELTFRKSEILAKIHERMHSDVIHDIRFR